MSEQAAKAPHPFGEFTEEDKGKRLKAWRPKKWRPEYERMVAMSCIGLSNKMIAKEVGYTKEHVSTILNMEEAENVRLMVLEKMRTRLLEIDIPARLLGIAKKTVKLMDESFDNETLVKQSPFALIDRGLDVLKGLGHLKGAGNGSGGGSTYNTQINVISSAAADDLALALRKSDEVRHLHSGAAKEIIVEAATKVEVTNGQK